MLSPLIFTAVLALGPALAQSAVIEPRISGVKITSVNPQGSGCPRGSVSYAISADAATAQLRFDDFTSTSTNTKTCQADITFTYPTGYRFAVQSAVYRVGPEIPSGTSLRTSSTYGFGSAAAALSTAFTLNGPRAGSVNVNGGDVSGGQTWSSCGGTSATLRVSTTHKLTGAGEVALETHQINLAWQTC
ncbi:hypothetical protein B0T16DRAFT_335382 [Cercophora newfieldiana]|uniref:DUF4360 domain-containing protein n=1 Tax=Cercophora newfieldiana TaxID=92897 RepID=A0AA40CJD8_9PEZI|nr:hypothetical protein B0T16DRAFT_335382 [Cercophora newfieldiana]